MGGGAGYGSARGYSGSIQNNQSIWDGGGGGHSQSWGSPDSAGAIGGGADDISNVGYVRMEELDLLKFRRILDVRTNMLVFAQALPGCIPISCICTFLSDYLSVEQGMAVAASTA